MAKQVAATTGPLDGYFLATTAADTIKPSIISEPAANGPEIAGSDDISHPSANARARPPLTTTDCR